MFFILYQNLQQWIGMINKLSTKLMRVVKKKEIEKVAAFRKSVADKGDGVDV